MLVLTRKKSESIMIGDNIEIVIVAIEGDIVRIGIKAPKNVEIFRKEVYRLIQQANKEASENLVTLSEISDFLKKPE